MISVRLTLLALALASSAALTGCFSAGSNQSDQEKEAHFQAGRARVNSMDYAGAIESFEKALEVNPHSAVAHFELGWLLADKEPNPAAAIYHYEQYLKLRPNAENAETIKQHIFRLKQDLAKAVLPLPATPGVQHELEQLAEENRRLKAELERYHAQAQVAQGNLPGSTALAARGTTSASQGLSGSDQRVQTPVRSSSPGLRTHKVQAGETLSAISKRYGVKLEALTAANSGLNPKRLQVGQLLNIPPP